MSLSFLGTLQAIESNVAHALMRAASTLMSTPRSTIAKFWSMNNGFWQRHKPFKIFESPKLSDIAYLRDNRPPPKRAQFSFSKDDGVSWAPATDTGILNPVTSLEAIALRNGDWIKVYNDLEAKRYSDDFRSERAEHWQSN